METFKCGKGFVATPSEDGSDTLVPFFIQVRDKDIIWSIDDFPKELVNLYCTNNDPTLWGIFPFQYFLLTLSFSEMKQQDFTEFCRIMPTKAKLC